MDLHPGHCLAEVELGPLVRIKVEVAVKDVTALLKGVIRDEKWPVIAVCERACQSLFVTLHETALTELLCQLADQLTILANTGQHLGITD